MPSRKIHIESVDDRVIEIISRKTPAERIAMILDANETARSLAAAGIRHCHPDWNERRLQAEVARRMLGDTG
jgi:hypothetical protein